MILLVLAGRGSERMGGDVVPATVHASGIRLPQPFFFTPSGIVIVVIVGRRIVRHIIRIK